MIRKEKSTKFPGKISLILDDCKSHCISTRRPGILNMFLSSASIFQKEKSTKFPSQIHLNFGRIEVILPWYCEAIDLGILKLL